MKTEARSQKSEARMSAAGFAFLFAALLFVNACPKNTSIPHPGAVSSFDSQSYDALLVAQEVINQAKDSLAAGKLPAGAKPVINRAIESYNVARGAWLTYRAAAGAGATDAATATANLQKALADLTAAVAAIPKLEGRTP